MKYLWSEWDKLKNTFSSARDKLVLLDFDGTLVSIAQTPSEVFVKPQTRDVLLELSHTPHVRLAIVSGRPLKELYSYLRLPRVFYIANHGLEIKGRGLSLPPTAKKARQLKHLIRLLAKKFENIFKGAYEGILVEDKRFTLSLHYRSLSKQQLTLFLEMVDFLKEKYKKYPLRWTHGKKVWEVQPSVFWGKGEAVFYLMKKFPEAVPVAVGDDRADEAMFKSVKNKGIAIRVGRSKNSEANYYLQSPYDVRVFLQKLCQTKNEPKSRLSSKRN